jgi:hypothetical protein
VESKRARRRWRESIAAITVSIEPWLQCAGRFYQRSGMIG